MEPMFPGVPLTFFEEEIESLRDAEARINAIRSEDELQKATKLPG